MREEVRERRIYMTQEYLRSLSERQTIESTAEKFGIKKSALYVDWGRRNKLLRELVDFKENSNVIRQLVIEVYRSLQEIEKLAQNADNDNCRLGAHKLRLNVLFKLIDLYRSYDNEELRERIEKVEKIVEDRRITEE